MDESKCCYRRPYHLTLFVATRKKVHRAEVHLYMAKKIVSVVGGRGCSFGASVAQNNFYLFGKRHFEIFRDLEELLSS